MEKINLKHFFLLAMMAMVAMTFSACGGDDDDDSGKDVGTGVGVHRIDVQFSTRQTSGLDCQCVFAAYRFDKKELDIYENGKKVSQDNVFGIENSAMFKGLQDISVNSSDGCVAMVASLTLMTDRLIPAAADVTVTFVAYVNGKRVKTQVATLPKGKTMMSVDFESGYNKTLSPVIK